MIHIRGILQRLLAGASSPELNALRCRFKHNLSQPTPLTRRNITELLSRNQITLSKDRLPSCVKSIECNQLGSNSPIEDRLRVSSVHLPGSREPTLMLGVFDGHGGGTTADLVSRRLFNYIALALHPEPQNLKISSHHLKDIVVDLHKSPYLDEEAFSVLWDVELDSLLHFKDELNKVARPIEHNDIVTNIKSSFQRCDDDLAREIQANLISSSRMKNDLLRYYLAASVSGCCAAVMIIHNGIGYLASTGDCRAVLGTIVKQKQTLEAPIVPLLDRNTTAYDYKAFELNDEHNCDNVNEVRRLAAAHPKSEQNTMIKHNRLLGHLMPFRAFGDFNYKWPADLIKASGMTRAFGSQIIPSSYETPPYLIVEPDVNSIQVSSNINGEKEPISPGNFFIDDNQKQNSNLNEYLNDLMIDQDRGTDSSMERYVVIASDGLWELFESSREVMEAIVDHSKNSKISPITIDEEEDNDKNCATHVIRSALQFRNSSQDVGADPAELKRRYHYRLEYTLSLPPSVVRNFRDDISIILMKLA